MAVSVRVACAYTRKISRELENSPLESNLEPQSSRHAKNIYRAFVPLYLYEKVTQAQGQKSRDIVTA